MPTMVRPSTVDVILSQVGFFGTLFLIHLHFEWKLVCEQLFPQLGRRATNHMTSNFSINSIIFEKNYFLFIYIYLGVNKKTF